MYRLMHENDTLSEVSDILIQLSLENCFNCM